MTLARRTQERVRPGAERRCAGLAALAVCAAVLLPASALPAQPSDLEVKAAFLAHFAQYVEWPGTAFSAPDAPIVLGVLGDDEWVAAIESAAGGKAVDAHTIVVDRLTAAAEARGCHIVFIAPARAGSLRDVLRSVGRAPVLVVGDSPAFAASGGVIGFIVRGKKVAFEISPAAAARAGLKVSSKLLRLAEIVDGA